MGHDIFQYFHGVGAGGPAEYFTQNIKSPAAVTGVTDIMSFRAINEGGEFLTAERAAKRDLLSPVDQSLTAYPAVFLRFH
jgi:hypothetical protein